MPLLFQECGPHARRYLRIITPIARRQRHAPSVWMLKQTGEPPTGVGENEGGNFFGRLLQNPSLCPLEAGHSEGFCIVFLGALNPWTVWHVLRSCFLQMAMAGDTNTARFCAVCADGRHSGRFLPNRPFHALLTNSPAMAGHRRSTRR